MSEKSKQHTYLTVFFSRQLFDILEYDCEAPSWRSAQEKNIGQLRKYCREAGEELKDGEWYHVATVAVVDGIPCNISFESL